ncbi:MAG: division/cell wall cluster transcriptional repressor MraZ [Bacteroidaceae bacterium]|nr:division/cell wall cluster transcriptional repressor MraZ [Bacteroidaceae bacterium]
MPARFIGNTDARMDDKGRVFFPAVFRRALQKEGDEALMIRRDVHQNCLVLYPKSVWEQQLDELRARLNRWNAQQQMVFRQFVAGVDELPIDGNGRILIPRRLIAQLGITTDVRFIGMDDTIELWPKAQAEALLDNPDALGAALESLMDTPNPATPNP